MAFEANRIPNSLDMSIAPHSQGQVGISCITFYDTVRLVLLCHKRSRTFTEAQYGQCPKALASATLN